MQAGEDSPKSLAGIQVYRGATAQSQPVSAVRVLLNIQKLGWPQTDPSNRALSFSCGPLCLQLQACRSRQAAAVEPRGLAHRRS